MSFELSGPRDPDGKLFVVQTEVTKTLSDMGHLFNWAETILGRKLTATEVDGKIDMTALLDKPISLEA